MTDSYFHHYQLRISIDITTTIIIIIIIIIIITTIIIITSTSMVVAGRLLPSYSLRLVKDNQKGRSEVSGKPLLCILSYKETGYRGEGERIVSLNPTYLVLDTPF